MPIYKLILPAPEIAATLRRIGSEDYVLIKSQDFLRMFTPDGFNDLVLATLRNLGTASSHEILGELAHSEVACDRQKVAGALRTLQDTGRVTYDPRKNVWMAEER